MKTLSYSTLLFTAALATPIAAATVQLSFAGPDSSAYFELTYGPATDTKYPDAYVVTGISGTFTDLSLGIMSAPVGPLVPVNFATPEPTNTLAPNQFSRFAVAKGLDPINNGFLTFDNLYWPGGSPQTADDYPFHGGVLDIYGLMFEIGGGRIVNFWSAGDFGGGPTYGFAVATSAEALRYFEAGVQATPEPGTIVMLGSGLVGLLAWRRRASR